MLYSSGRTDPELRVNATKSILVLIPSPVEINRAIHPLLNHLEKTFKQISIGHN